MATIRNTITEKDFASKVTKFENRFSEWYNCYILPAHSGQPLPLTGAFTLLEDISHDLTEYLNSLSGKRCRAFVERADGTFTSTDLPANIKILASLADVCNGLLILLDAMNYKETENQAKDAAVAVAEMVNRDFHNFALAL